MSRTSRPKSPYLRQGRRSKNGAMPGQLALSAGLADRPSVEALEPRQMLFALTITADSVDPATGIGTARAYFGYSIPILNSSFVPGTAAPTTKTEGFDDDNPGVVFSGQFFTASAIRAVHNIVPAGDFRIDPPDTQQTARYIRVVPKRTTDFFQFESWNDPTNPTFRQLGIAGEFTVAPDGVSDNTGLDTDRTRVDLLANNVVVGSFTGAALRAAIVANTGNPALGTGTFRFTLATGFDTMRVVLTGDYQGNPALRVDNVSFTIPAGNYSALPGLQGYGAVAVLSGPVGASAVFTDLQGRDMVQTIRTGLPQGGVSPLVDLNDDGRPDFNDGIGNVRILGSDERTALSMWGVTITSTTQPTADDDFFENGFAARIVPTLSGLFDEWEGLGFGFVQRVQGTSVTVSGLPPGSGSVVIGSPWVRGQNDTPGRTPNGVGNPVTTGFTRSDQGIWVDGGSINSIYVHGMVMGSSRVRGSIDRYYAGYQLGSLTVDGDLGTFSTSTDAGEWSPDPGFQPTQGQQVDPINKTGAQLIVGRTVGEIAIAGRSLLDITVVGDLNSPTTRPARDSFNYYEREFVFGVNTSVELRQNIRTLLNNTNFVTRNPTDLFRGADQPIVIGDHWSRNDTIMGAEWVGSAASGARIRGELSGRDVSNGEDRADVYAFAADGTQDIVIESTLSTNSPYIRLVDSDGRTLAAPQQPFNQRNNGGNERFGVTQLRYRPTGPGVYYLVIGDPNANDTAVGNTSYTLVITGMATSSLGSYRTGGGSGFTDLGTGEGNAVTVLSGSIGALRIGMGAVDGGGADAGVGTFVNTSQDDDDLQTFGGGTFSAPGSLYSITTGSDFGGPGNANAGATINITLGGDLGYLVTGLHPGVGGGPNEGDLNFLNLRVGGRIGFMDVRGGIGMDQDNVNDPRAPVGTNVVNITTGTAGRGDIGMIRVGFHLAGDSMNIRTSAGSTIGSVLISQDTYRDENARSGIYRGTRGLPITTGAGSDVRFVDFETVDTASRVNTFLPLIGDRPLNIVDDSGAIISLRVENAPEGFTVGQVRVIPIDGSQGVAIAQLSVDLSGGRILRIEPAQGGGSQPSNGVVGIGRLVLTGADAGSAVHITGNVQVDVRYIDGGGAIPVDGGGGGGGPTGALGLNELFNDTPGGDILAADLGFVNFVRIAGNLGSTEMPAFGPANYGPLLGVTASLQGGVGDPLGFAVVRGGQGGGAGAGIDDDFNGATFRPVSSDNFVGGQASLDEVGAPMDVYLNGLVVRQGSVQQVLVNGSVGDVILQGGNLIELIANNDRITALGRFDGIVGTIYADDIVTIDIGDGLIGSTSPLATAGIFANDDIFQITSRALNPVIRGIISASNARAADNFGIAADGIDQVILQTGSVDGAFISSQNIDAFWEGFNYGDDRVGAGDIQTFTLAAGNLRNSEIAGVRLSNINITGYYDASSVTATGNIGTVSVSGGFRNSSLTGDRLELRESLIRAGENLERIVTPLDISDLEVDVLGDISRGITATSIIRSNFNVANEIKSVTLTRDLRASQIIAGSVPTITVGNNIQSSNITISGTLTTVTAGNRIANTTIAVTGPSGSIGTITAPNGISGAISATGPIGTVTTQADLTASITTTGPTGNVAALSAGRDLAITADISGNVASLTAGRHIGDRATGGVILVRGNLATASAPNGQLYADLRSGGTISTVTLGSATSKPGNDLVGRGSVIAFLAISNVTVNGDFGGSIISYSGGLGTVAINNGSLLGEGMVAAYDGSIASFTITNGSLFGDVHADRDITSLRVVAGSDGVFGDIGINPGSSALISYDSRRNQLPAGVGISNAIDGPRIDAGRDIVAVVVNNGSVFESSFFAGRSIKSIAVTGSVGNDGITAGTSSFFAAGDSIDSITISGSATSTAFVAGLVSLGADNALGGIDNSVAANADVVKSGVITKVTVGGGTRDVTYSAGVSPGADGIYNTGDDQLAQGLSRVDTLGITGSAVNTSVYADALSASVAGDGRLTRRTDLPNMNGELDNGQGTPGTSFSGSQSFSYGGGTLTLTVAGPGQFFFNSSNGRLTVRGGTSATNITVKTTAGSLDNFDIVTNDDASLGNVTFQSTVGGDSDLIVDGNIANLVYTNFNGTGGIILGGDLTSATFANMSGGSLTARNAPSIKFTSSFGGTTRPFIRLLSGGTIAVTGNAQGLVSVDRDLTSFTVSGDVNGSVVRTGGSLGTFAARNVNRSFVSTGENLTAVSLSGSSFDSAFMAGFDLGADAGFGGTGVNADRISNGNLGTVAIAGSFRESDAVAGIDRGPDGYFGSSDDRVSPGRSSLGTVTIGIAQVGSTRNSESYRIASNGSVGAVTIGGQIVAPGQSVGAANFFVNQTNAVPAPVQVNDISVQITSTAATAVIQFNQPVDASTISASLTVSEVRGDGDIEIYLIEGIDYTTRYNASDNSLSVIFSTNVTGRDLPQVPGRPGPGVYRFRFSQNLLRAQLANQLIDGNKDGFTLAGDDFSADAQVGDAGDKITAGTATNNGHRVDFYAPVNLDVLLDDNRASDGLAQPNVTYSIRGSIGDHPDNDTDNFSFAGDVDLYRITLQAGQIVNLGALQGPALRAGLTLLDATGAPVGQFNTADSVVSLPVPTGDQIDLTFPVSYLIKTTGTYYIAVGQTGSVGTTSTVPNPVIPPGGIGDYNFTFNIFDDGDSGFTSTTNAGDGVNVANAPAPADFAGPDGVFGTGDDRSTVISGEFSFTLDRGPDGRPNTADDRVTGTNGAGITSTRETNGNLISTINASIGPAGHVGTSRDIAPDVDVYHLNNRSSIAPGTKMRLTLRLNDLGGDFGSPDPLTRTDNRGAVQFGLFDTSDSSRVDDASLVFSPTDFNPTGGAANTTIADNGSTKYGYDSKGDFYIEFVMPDRLTAPGQAGTYAVYLQGVNNTDYQLEVATVGTGQIVHEVQNVLIETSGGQVNWLQAGGVTTFIPALDLRPIGFTGRSANGLPVQDYVISTLKASLNSLFVGYNIRFSDNPAEFEGQAFSTVFLSGATDPVAPLVSPFSGNNFSFLSNTFVSTQPYGASQHSDPFNADITDEAAVFIPSFALLGFSPSQTDIDLFTQSLTAAVSRRVGELVGLRITEPNGTGSTAFDPFAADSVSLRPGQGRSYAITATPRDLSNSFDEVTRTDFALGRQNARSLLDKILLGG